MTTKLVSKKYIVVIKFIYNFFLAGEDEVTFDPDEIIENIEQVDACVLHTSQSGFKQVFLATTHCTFKCPIYI